MRSSSDRLRHAISFEVIGLALAIPLGDLLFGIPAHDFGVVALVGATAATLWNYVYNVIFDRALLRIAGRLNKPLPVRIAHAVLFEAGILAIMLPFIAWYLGIGLLEAFALDVCFAIFYMVYAFAFNWLYDVIFPVPEPHLASDFA